MAFIQSTGIVFGNGTTLDSKYGIIPQNSTQIFYQASAPTGWTKVTFHDPPTNSQSVDNKALRIVSGTGGSYGGSRSFTQVFPATAAGISTMVTLGGTVGATTLDLTQLPIHQHGAGGSFPNFAGSAGSSPFRQEVRNPIAYAFRSSYRQIVNQRNIVNFRQPTTVRQPQYYRQPRTYQRPTNFQQPRDFRRPYLISSRFPYTAWVSFRQPRSYQRPYSYRRPYFSRSYTNWQRPTSYFRPGGGWRRPIYSWFGSYRRPYGGYGGGYFVSARRPYLSRGYTNWQAPRSFGFPVNQQSPSYTTQPRRQPVYSNNQQPNSYRRPYSFGTPVSYRAVVNFRATVNQRNPAYYRQPTTYRVAVRYPVVNNVRYATRVLVPGGTIRGIDQNGPSTSSVGGGQAHSHPFTGSTIPLSGSIDLRLQYIDVIICKFN
jgi:hypothetical protein